MIRPASDITGAGPGRNRTDRVRDWGRRNNPRGEDLGTPPAGHGGQVSPGSASMPPAAEATTRGQQLYRSGEQPQAAPTQRSFLGKVKDHAKTVSAGVAGAAAGALGDDKHATGSVATATGDETTAVPPLPQGTARRTRKARLRLSQVDPWSVMKTAFLFSIAAGIVLWVATGIIWAVISASGMFNEINKMVGDIIQTPGDDSPFRIQDYIGATKIMGTAALIAVIDVVIFTALATLGAFLYNLASGMIGGLEVTLAED